MDRRQGPGRIFTNCYSYGWIRISDKVMTRTNVMQPGTKRSRNRIFRGFPARIVYLKHDIQ